MSALLELAARCEAAVGSSGKLDEKIAVATGWLHDGRLWELRNPYRLVSKAPRFTAALDVAATLIPDGWNWMAGIRNPPTARAYVENGKLAFIGAGTRRNPDRQWFEVVAETPALALCAAALKARHFTAASSITEGTARKTVEAGDRGEGITS